MHTHLSELSAEGLAGIVHEHAAQHIDHADLAVAFDQLAAVVDYQCGVVFRARRIIKRR